MKIKTLLPLFPGFYQSDIDISGMVNIDNGDSEGEMSLEHYEETDYVHTNRVIALFMGWEEQTNPNEKFFGSFKDSDHIVHGKKSSLLFHYDWNLLIQVVEKIEELNFVVEIKKDFVRIRCSKEKTIVVVLGGEFKDKLDATYNACVMFITQYKKLG